MYVMIMVSSLSCTLKLTDIMTAVYGAYVLTSIYVKIVDFNNKVQQRIPFGFLI